MKVYKTLQDIQTWRKGAGTASVGFVATMGALHAGHAELLKRARRENEKVVLSIFVNPTQFNDPKDLEKYPRTLESDLEIAAAENVDAVWTPDRDQMYPDNYRYKIVETNLSAKWCGAYRPGHFEGMLSVVMKLLQVVSPTRAYFGEKDYQQLLLIQEMARAFFLPFKIVAVPTVREFDGLAMSSRNIRLTPAERELAPRLFNIISKAATPLEATQELTKTGFKVEYVEDYQDRRLAAVWLGHVRLIDNVRL